MAGLILIVGSGPSVWDDLQDFWDMSPADHSVMCVNDAGKYYPCEFDHWASLHGAWLHKLADSCCYNGHRHMHQPQGGREHVWPIRRCQGSSGMFAVEVALMLGYDRVVLVGVPIMDIPNVFHPEKPGTYATDYMQAWQLKAPSFGGMVRSMSGNTMALLGRPDTDFVGG